MRPVFVKRSQLQSKIFHSSSKSNFRAAASSTRMPSGSTSLPMPSPGTTAILCFIGVPFVRLLRVGHLGEDLLRDEQRFADDRHADVSREVNQHLDQLVFRP